MPSEMDWLTRKVKCYKHGEFVGIVSCPVCDREEYVAKRCRDAQLPLERQLDAYYKIICNQKNEIERLEADRKRILDAVEKPLREYLFKKGTAWQVRADAIDEALSVIKKERK